MAAYSSQVDKEDDKHVRMHGKEKQLAPLEGKPRLRMTARTMHPACACLGVIEPTALSRECATSTPFATR